MAVGTYGLASSPPIIVLWYIHVSEGMNAVNAMNAMNTAAVERMVHASPTHFFRANQLTVSRRKVI